MASGAQKSAWFCFPRTGLKVSSSSTTTTITQLFVCLFVFETWFHYIDHAGLELIIVLLQPLDVGITIKQ